MMKIEKIDLTVTAGSAVTLEKMEYMENQSLIELPEEVLQNITIDSPSEESFEVGDDGKRRPTITGKSKKSKEGRPESKKKKR